MHRRAITTLVVITIAALTTATGVAAAQAPTPPLPGTPAPTQRSIVTYGNAQAAPPARITRATLERTYRRALQRAIAEATSKAGFLAARVGLVLGPVHSVFENSSTALPADIATCVAERRRSLKARARRARPAPCFVYASVTISYTAG